MWGVRVVANTLFVINNKPRLKYHIFFKTKTLSQPVSF